MHTLFCFYLPLILCLFGKHCMPSQFTLVNRSPVTYLSQSQTHAHSRSIIGQCLLYSLCLTVVSLVLYTVDKGLRGRNVLHQLLLILLRICSRSVRPIGILTWYHVCYVMVKCTWGSVYGIKDWGFKVYKWSNSKICGWHFSRFALTLACPVLMHISIFDALVLSNYPRIYEPPVRIY